MPPPRKNQRKMSNDKNKCKTLEAAIDALIVDRDWFANQLDIVCRERDEARREICARTAYPDRTPQMEAKMRGWNCYEAQEQAMNRLAQLDEELGLI